MTSGNLSDFAKGLINEAAAAFNGTLGPCVPNNDEPKYTSAQAESMVKYWKGKSDRDNATIRSLELANAELVKELAEVRASVPVPTKEQINAAEKIQELTNELRKTKNSYIGLKSKIGSEINVLLQELNLDGEETEQANQVLRDLDLEDYQLTNEWVVTVELTCTSEITVQASSREAAIKLVDETVSDRDIKDNIDEYAWNIEGYSAESC